MRQIRTGLFLCAGMIALATPAFAQDGTAAPGASETTGVTDIIVTARKKAESLQNVPLSITGIGAEEIADRDISSIGNIDNLAPSVFIETAAGPTTSGVVANIRGIGGSDSTGVSDYPIAMYIDGVLMSRPNALLFDMVDLERIEVLRGPQGTLFGRNTTGGAINIFTKAPSDTFGLEEKLTIGSDNLLKSRTTINTGQWGDSGISAKLAYSHEEQDGYVKNTLKKNTADPGARNSESGFLAIHGDVSPSFSFDLRADVTSARNAPIWQQLTAINPLQYQYFSQSESLGGAPLIVDNNYRKRVTIADQPRGKQTIWGTSLTMEYEVSPALTLKSITGYRRFKESQAVNNDGQGELLGRLVNGSIGRVYMFDYPEPARARDRQFSTELQATGTISDFDYVVGLYYFDQKYGSITTQHFTSVVQMSPTDLRGANLVSLRDYETRARSYAAFTQVSWKPSAVDGLEITGGLRFTHDKKELSQANAFNGAALRPGFAKNSWDNLSWLGSVTYRFSPELLVYARVSTAYRAGGFDAGGGGNPNGYDPEKAVSYEAGLKTDLLDRRLRINLSGYITDYKDLQISQFTAGSNGGGTRTVNAGKVTFSGFEAEATAVLADFLTLDGSVGYVHPKYKTYLYRNPSDDKLINVADEVHLAHVSKWTARVGGAWDIAQWDSASLSLRVDYSYKSSAPTFPLDRVSPFNPYIRRSAQNELSARLTLKDVQLGEKLNLTIQAYGENILNEKRRISAVDFGALGFATRTWGPDRRFGLTVTAAY
ncbi:TonB-dependent receptor [Caenibius tardaugens]|uniref:TonB-dependent receptor n=1 Tax=Caenibius tardaugens TaxID=169176 RepID=UPI000415B065|nr:TonB-dependent receptor [Caenibius tardaugens]AZI36608.1 TonB-dependent receptor [Caenibius tardaugens NBRC 16725]